MTVYVEFEALKTSLELEGTTFSDDDVEEACAAASGQIERMMNRDFGQDLSQDERFYTAHHPRKLVVHDYVSLSEVATDDDADGTFETVWATTDYVLEPFNAAADIEPYTRLTVPRFGTRDFPTNIKRGVRLTGVWGWPEVPSQITAVTAIIATQLVKRKREAPFGFVIGPEAAAYIARSDPTIAGQLNDLKRNKLVSE